RVSSCSPLPRTSLLRPPRSPLFPYTTLFRSYRGDKQHISRIAPPIAGLGALPLEFSIVRAGAAAGMDAAVWLAVSKLRIVKRGLDRKSIRLNSSHVSISYAVFCLKKKIRNM